VNVRRHRARQRAQGLRPVQFWLPDTNTPEFLEQVAHDIAAVARPNAEDDAMQEALEHLADETLAEWRAEGLLREDWRLQRGTVVVASVGAPSGKPRPFVVLRSDRFSQHALVTLLPFTSELQDAPTLRVTVEPTEANGLQRPSQVMIDRVQSIFAARVERMIGQLGRADMQAVERAVAVYLGFADRWWRFGRGGDKFGSRPRFLVPRVVDRKHAEGLCHTVDTGVARD
jgi:mRNA interferase MazF